MRGLRPIPLLLMATLTFGCAQSRVARLDPIDPHVATPIPFPAIAYVPPETAAREYRAAGTLIEIGEAFEQYAHAYIRRGFAGTGDSLTVTAELVKVHAQGFRIELDAEIRVDRNDRLLSRAVYSGVSSGNAWDGMYSDRNLYWAEASGQALRSLFKQFLADVHSKHQSW